jgi:ParB family transcriptional regulator, chromosome partitioning protein
MPRNALGKGLSALIREPQQPPPLVPEQSPAAPATPVPATPTYSPSGAATAVAPAPTEGLIHADIDLIDPSPYQPRSRFREAALDELAQSIRSSGIVQPIVVRRVGARFQLIAGERRWRAAQRAGLARVPAILRAVGEEVALEMTLVENLQREDLNPIEQARAFARLIEEFQLTQEQVAERTGKDRATVANALRLLKLEETIQDLLEEGRLTAGHGRALLAIADAAERLALAKRIARGGMTVRQVERYASRGDRPRTEAEAPAADPNTKEAIEELQREYGTRVMLRPTKGAKPGELIFEYYNDSDLLRIYDRLMRR